MCLDTDTRSFSVHLYCGGSPHHHLFIALSYSVLKPLGWTYDTCPAGSGLIVQLDLFTWVQLDLVTGLAADGRLRINLIIVSFSFGKLDCFPLARTPVIRPYTSPLHQLLTRKSIYVIEETDSLPIYSNVAPSYNNIDYDTGLHRSILEIN